MSDKILLVDDDKEFRAEFRDYFGEYRILEASTAEEALEILGRPNKIDLVITDVRMPGMGGLKALKKMREAAPAAAIILITGYGTKEVVIEALRGGAGNYLEKPFDLEKARAMIEEVLGKAKGEEDAGLTDGKGKVEKVKNFLRRNCLKKVRLEDAANEVFISPKHLSRIFKSHAGVGFNEYYLQLKMEKAMEFLTTTGYSVDHISDKLGYENTESFIRQFKKLSGKTPTAYRAVPGPAKKPAAKRPMAAAEKKRK